MSGYLEEKKKRKEKLERDGYIRKQLS